MNIIVLLKNIGIFAIGGICTKAISFLMIPIYTALISVDDYGTIDLLGNITSLLVPMAGIQIHDAIFKFITLERDKKKNIIVVFSNAIVITLGTSGVYLIVYLIISQLFDIRCKWYLLVYVLVYIFFQISSNTSRSLGDNKLYALAGFVSGAFTVLLTIVFLIVLKFPALSILWANVIGVFLGGLICFVKNRLWRYFSIDVIEKKIIKELVHYSVPLVPNEMAWWMIHASDRVIVSLFLGIYANGILAIATKFSMIYSIVFGFFYTAWVEQFFLYYKKNNNEEYIETLIPKILCVFFLFTVVLIVLLSYSFYYIVDSSYYEAYELIPCYLMAVSVNVIIGVISPVYLVNNETKTIMISTIISGLINIIVNVGLINYIGLIAAPLSAFVGYGVVAWWRWIDVRKRYLSLYIDPLILFQIIVMIGLSLYIYYSDIGMIKIVITTILLVGELFLLKQMKGNF